MNFSKKKYEDIINLYEEACGKTYYSTKVLDCKYENCDSLYCTNNLNINLYKNCLFVEFCNVCDRLFCNFHIYKKGDSFFCEACFNDQC